MKNAKFETDEIYKQIPIEDIDLENENDSMNIEDILLDESKRILKIKNQDNLKVIRDSHYYFSVYFISESDKIKFLSLLDILNLGTDMINGYELARHLNLDFKMQDCHLPEPAYFKQFKKKKNEIKRVRRRGSKANHRPKS